MKSFVFTLLVVMMSVGASLAQIKVEIKEETRSMSKASANALVMDLPGVNEKDAGKAWSKFSKGFKGKTKYDRKGGEYFTDDATIKDMSDNTVDMVAKVTAKGEEGCEIAVWFNLGASYLSSKDYADRYPAGEAVMKSFANEVSASMIEEELKLQEKILKDMEGDLKKLEKDKATREKDIEGYKETITKMEENIVTAEGDIKQNVEDQGAKGTEIEGQTKLIDEIKARLEEVKGRK
ncbi:MAG: hypothetical protein GY810_20645 [Aureispira sp.]|nr:hypothetical protein [Aureispira sp.]